MTAVAPARHVLVEFGMVSGHQTAAPPPRRELAVDPT